MGRLPPPPASLKPLQMFLKTADEFDRREQSISYFCRSYAAKLGIEKYRNAETTPFLMQLLDVIEADKKVLAESEAVKSDIVGQSKLYDTAIKLFAVADTKDRSGESTKEVAQTFYTSMVLFETLRYFGDLEDETHEKLKYAKWKAAYIIKCLREGVIPVPGPVDAEGNPLPDEPNVAPHAAAAAAAAASAFDSLPDVVQHFPPPQQQQQQQQFYPPQQPPAATSAPQYQQQWSQPQAHQQPTPPVQPTRPFQPPAAAQNQTPPLPYFQQPPPQQQQQQPPQQQTWQPQPPQAAPRPAAPLAFAGQSFTPKGHVSIADNEQASKYAKFVISALQYNDTPTAVENLLKALRVLTA